MKRRTFLYGSAGATALAAFAGLFSARSAVTPAMASTAGDFEVVKSEAEWRALLTDMQYSVLREEATERAFTSPLNEEKRKGLFHCAGCDQALYSSETKFDSGTGWPSFWQAEAGAVATKVDDSLFMARTECHCSRCGGHLGHIFEDGPPPTGLRHCINGVSLSFKPAEGQASG